MLDFQKRFRYAVPARTVTQSPVFMPTFPFLLLNSQLHCFYCLFVLPACSFSLSFPDTVRCVLLELHNTYLLSYFHILFMTFGMRLPPSFLILFSSLCFLIFTRVCLEMCDVLFITYINVFISRRLGLT